MPNHITNLLEFNCSEDRFREIAEFLHGERKDEPLGVVDFNVLIPMPKPLMIESGSVGERGYEAYATFIMESDGLPPDEVEALREKHMAKLDDPEAWDLGEQYYNNIRNYGAKTWYQWAYANWGTKWNSYDCEPADIEGKTLCFHTAWEGVPKIIEKIAEKFPDADIIYSWADEDIGSNVGILVYEDGRETGSVLPENGSRQAYELAAQIMGLDLKEMGFVLSKDGSTYEFDMEASEIPVEEHPTPSGEAR